MLPSMAMSPLMLPMEDDGPEAAAEDGTLNWNQSYAAVASNTKTLELHLY